MTSTLRGPSLPAARLRWIFLSFPSSPAKRASQNGTEKGYGQREGLKFTLTSITKAKDSFAFALVTHYHTL